MNLLYMKYFCDAVRMGSITAAAKENFVTQSAVTQGIAKLEVSLNCSLLARHPNRLRLTPDGQNAFLEMSEVLKKIAKIQQTFSKDYTHEIGDLDFVCTHSFGLSIIPPLLKKFRKHHPRVKVTFSLSANLTEIKRMLRLGRIDFGIAPSIGDFSGFEKRALLNGTFSAYVSKKVSPEEEKKMEFILPEPEDTTFFKKGYLDKFGKYPDVFLEVGSWEVIANLTIEGLGIGYFPDYIALKKMQWLRRCDIEIEFPKYQIYAFFPEGMKIRKSSEIFLSYFDEANT